MVITTNAIVLSSLKYSEADLIVKCYTESSGLKSYLLKNILKSRKGKLKASYFQPLTLLDLEVVHKDKGNLERIKEAKILQPYNTLHTKVVKSAMVIFIAEILTNSIQEEIEDKELFQFLLNSFIWLDENNEIANFHILFLLKLSLHLGFYPDTSTTAHYNFNLMEGNFQAINDGKYCENGAHVEMLKQFFGIKFDKISQIKPTKKVRLDILNLMLLYYQLHLQSFKKPKSLLVLNQIFE